MALPQGGYAVQFSYSIVRFAPKEETTRLNLVGAAFVTLESRISSPSPQTPLLQQTLLAAADPVILVDGSGLVTWFNHAADKLRSRLGWTKALDTIVGEEVAKTILQTTQFSAISCQLAVPGNAQVSSPHTAVVLEVGSGDPGACLYLISFRATCAPEEAIREKTQFLATVAHDLKNPLGAIFGYVDALLDTRAGDGLAAGHRETLRRIRRAALRSIDLVRNYQLIAQRGQLRKPPPGTSVDLRNVVQSVLEYCMRSGEGEPALDVSFPADGLQVCVERTPLERLTANLVANAYAYTPPAGKIEISAQKIGRMVEFRVRNTGSTLSPEEIATIFKPYQRGHAGIAGAAVSKTAEITHGSGLGLSIVQAIVDSADGEIKVESSLENGTTFVVRLPAA